MKKYYLAVLISAFFSSNLLGQQVDSVKLAMKDELERSIKELSHEKYEKPFYVGYSVNDLHKTTVHAFLGGILASNEARYRSLNARVLVGDYNFNDESLSENFVEPYYGPDDMNIPIEDDYYGIRRSLWSVTDKVYKTAGEVFESHKRSMEQKGDTEETTFLKFSSHEPVHINSISRVKPLSLEQIEKEVQNISAMFLDYPDLSVSNVMFTGADGASYFINSEGSDVYLERDMASLVISVALQNEDGRYIFDQYSYINEAASKIFSETDFTKEVVRIYKNLKDQEMAKQFEDSYEGPVIFIDDAVPHIFSHVINQFRPEPPKSEETRYSFNPQFSLESKLNEKIFSESLSITLTPSMKTYDGKPLLGQYQIDQEGIVPHEKIVLVKEGTVNDLMVGRNFYKENLKPNGTASGPGVVHIDINKTKKSLKALKKEMLKIASDQGLEYGLIITKINNQQLKVYKVYKDGREELYQGATIRNFDKKSLNKIEGALAEKEVHNFMGSNNNATYISPKAVLIRNVEVDPSQQSQFKMDPPLVKSPLEAIQSKD